VIDVSSHWESHQSSINDWNTIMALNIGQYNVRRAVQIRASRVQIWREFHDVLRLNAWFGLGHVLEVYEPHLGGQVELSIEQDGLPVGFGGEILVFEEGRELSFENNWFGELAWEVPTFITIRLTSVNDGTLVELFHHGFERLGKDGDSQYLAYESSWDVHHLAALKHIVEGS
jgi:uncharacterized protein YndB with AHSA1/START domain